MTPQLVDIHSHLNDRRYALDLPDVLARMRAAQVASIVVGTDKKMSEDAIALAALHPDLWATIGLHPTDNHSEAFDAEVYEAMARHPRVVAIGECGLDYYWPSKTPKNEENPQRSDLCKGLTFVEKERQRVLFEEQIVIAKKVGKPLMIHGRPTPGTMDAYEDILHILNDYPDVRGNVHFFVGNIPIATKFLALGFTMSFTGVLTFTHDYDEVVRFLPLDSIMAETDAPYVAPAPHRGKRNEPAFVRETVARIAAIKILDKETARAQVVKNAIRVFQLP